ncbi:hypothetical protein CXB51_021822 [Gossypium anomalum]|uniref:RNase H type-1 domain-containing protein n=1 Tax=Gossypium anomalum TaxID=47600 RepID=A0A8J6CVG4_9ROSI|nr:hypothetical protein CXB51_021822 [Gossypium anomalum]
MNGLVFQSKLRALMWVRAVHNELSVEERLWWFCPIKSWNEAFKAGMGGGLWCPPRKGWVKFNLYGVVNEDEAGCGGVLRDLNGVARAVFSGPIVAKDSLVAEVVAIIIALEMFLAMAEIDSKVASLGNVCFAIADKNGNDLAFALAVAEENYLVPAKLVVLVSGHRWTCAVSKNQFTSAMRTEDLFLQHKDARLNSSDGL